MIPTQFLLSSDHLNSLAISDMASGAPTVLYWKQGKRYMNWEKEEWLYVYREKQRGDMALCSHEVT